MGLRYRRGGPSRRSTTPLPYHRKPFIGFIPKRPIPCGVIRNVGPTLVYHALLSLSEYPFPTIVWIFRGKGR